MKASDITSYLEQYFPLDLQLSWDKCGLQIGDLNQEVNKIMVALNADNETLLKALENKCDMLITHHPFLLESINNLDTTKAQGVFINQVINNNILVYSLHTCLDVGIKEQGMNTWLISKLGVKDIMNYDDTNIGKCAVLNNTYDANDFISFVKDTYKIQQIRYSRSSNKKINTVAICGGSGADDLEKLVNKVDVFITGDTKYRHVKYAIDNNILLIDIGHHAEVIMEEKVKELLGNLEIEVITANSTDYYEYK